MTSTSGSPTVGYAPVNGIELYYELHGSDGPPLVVLHGGALTIDLSFAALLPSLAANHRVIAIELQGHGHTADNDRPMSLEVFSDDVVALLDHLGVERADLLGFSLGGLVALRTAVRHPERIDHLVLLATHYRHDGYHAEITAPEQTSERLPTAADFAAMVDAYARVAPDPTRFEATMAKLQPLAHGFVEWTEDELRSIDAPTLLVIGDTDFIRIEHAARMYELIPHAHLAILPDTTHMNVPANTDLLVPMLDAFLPTKA
ncbi:alpha/beta fold hydrolase [Embleya scabrispora]|uniref:alpha/beta fold hydrolase n=1 Tax=Embleya scabrispora TaxID=159449 RepID=UPI00039E8E35|nr:alpha/beta hydrolase [Embleya scabrispora]MYS85933.1 alpha/beta fold hydrolase [Streptomyces sp. SID5474]